MTTRLRMGTRFSNGKVYYDDEIIPQEEYDQFTDWEKEHCVVPVEKDKDLSSSTS